MSSGGWAKNEVNAAKRRVSVSIVSVANNGPALPGVDFMALGIVYLSGSTQPNYALATGTMTNNRKPIGVGAAAIADDTVEAVDFATNDTLQLTAHLFETGDGPVRFTTTGTLPAGLALATDYWLIKFDANNVRVATSLANAYANTFINLTSAGTGTHTLDVTTSTFRGVRGEFTYEATQAETNHDGKETLILVDGPGYERHLFAGGGATVVMQEPAATAFNQTGEGAYTYGDLIRLLVAVCFGKVGNYTAPPYSFKALDGVKVRATNNADATGRLTAVVGDLTP